jgi:stage V sporulation protein R
VQRVSSRTVRELGELQEALEEIYAVAGRFGLDPFPIYFEVVPSEIMYEFGAYGLPGRFSHWTHGKAYHQMKTMYDHGLSKIYELVINTNPSYAFLMESNSVLQNKLVAAHVIGHCDFFKNSAYFARTNRQMLESASVSAERLRRYEFEHGRREVEDFLDAVLTVDDHIDPHALLAKVRPEGEDDEPRPRPRTAYDDLFDLEAPKEEPAPKARKFPTEPQKDLLAFLIEHSRELEDWQRDVLGIVRQEALYFVPQMQTKVMNEGWASFWHARIMRELDLPSGEYLEFADMHSSVLSPSKRSMNPYYLGMKMLEDIERRWDEPTEEEQKTHGRKPGGGRAKLFEVREMENDVSFLRNYLTEELITELDLFVYERQGDEWVIIEKDWEKVRDQLVASMTNFGQPYIVVEDGDYRRNGELYLKHCFEGAELDIPYAEKTLAYVHRLWGRPVHLETIADDKLLVFSFDGAEHSRKTT